MIKLLVVGGQSNGESLRKYLHKGYFIKVIT